MILNGDCGNKAKKLSSINFQWIRPMAIISVFFVIQDKTDHSYFGGMVAMKGMLPYEITDDSLRRIILSGCVVFIFIDCDFY